MAEGYIQKELIVVKGTVPSNYVTGQVKCVYFDSTLKGNYIILGYTVNFGVWHCWNTSVVNELYIDNEGIQAQLDTTAINGLIIYIALMKIS